MTPSRVVGTYLPLTLNNKWGWSLIGCPTCGEFSGMEKGDTPFHVHPDNDANDSPAHTRGGFIETRGVCSACGYDYSLVLGNHKGALTIAIATLEPVGSWLDGLASEPPPPPRAGDTSGGDQRLAGIVVNDWRSFDYPDRQPVAHLLTDDGTFMTICGHPTYNDGEPAFWWIRADDDINLWRRSRPCKNCVAIRKRDKEKPMNERTDRMAEAPHEIHLQVLESVPGFAVPDDHDPFPYEEQTAPGALPPGTRVRFRGTHYAMLGFGIDPKRGTGITDGMEGVVLSSHTDSWGIKYLVQMDEMPAGVPTMTEAVRIEAVDGRSAGWSLGVDIERVWRLFERDRSDKETIELHSVAASVRSHIKTDTTKVVLPDLDEHEYAAAVARHQQALREHRLAANREAPDAIPRNVDCSHPDCDRQRHAFDDDGHGYCKRHARERGLL